MNLREELQDAATDAIQKIFDEICKPTCEFSNVLEEDQMQFVLAVCRVICEEMIIRYDECIRP